MPKKRMPLHAPWEPPKPAASPNPIPDEFGATRKVGASTLGRSRGQTDKEWWPEWKRSAQPQRQVNPIRNARGGARGLSPTETPDRMDGNK